VTISDSKRRQLGHDELRIVRGIDAQRPSGDEVAALMRVLSDKLESSRESGSVEPLLDFLYSNMTSGADLLSEAPIACGRGCAHCCYIPWVDASPAEVLFVAKAISPAERRQVAEAVAAKSERVRGKSLQERAGIITACPLLKDGACSVYAARPLACRTLVSTDSGTCRRAYMELSREQIPSLSAWRLLGAAYMVALEAAIVHAGLVTTARDLVDSLHIALNDPDAEAKWLAGEDVFRDAPCNSTASAFETPSWAYLYRQAFGAPAPIGR
jgi:Fe-S-cluster containining protein